MSRHAKFIGAAAIAALVSVFPILTGSAADRDSRLSPEARLVLIRRAQVWSPTDIPSMNIKAGPQGPGAFAPNETITCDYVDKKMTGRSPKFTCALAPEDELKVKFGRDNGEVFAEVAASRLLWALGFGADHMYPVRIVCRGCPADLDPNAKRQGDQTTFDYATVERKLEGHELEGKELTGWAWPELDLVEETAGGAPRAQRDALKLLAVMLQHTDSKPEQQRLACLPGGQAADGGLCAKPFMMISDLGLTFGHANVFNRGPVGSVNIEQWTRESVWDDPKRCIGNITKSQTGTLDHPQIGEAGRKFLADLLSQLTAAQLHDLFEVARFPERTGPSIRPASVDQWVAAFEKRRDEIVNHTCPS